MRAFLHKITLFGLNGTSMTLLRFGGVIAALFLPRLTIIQTTESSFHGVVLNPTRFNNGLPSISTCSCSGEVIWPISLLNVSDIVKLYLSNLFQELPCPLP